MFREIGTNRCQNTMVIVKVKPIAILALACLESCCRLIGIKVVQPLDNINGRITFWYHTGFLELCPLMRRCWFVMSIWNKRHWNITTFSGNRGPTVWKWRNSLPLRFYGNEKNYRTSEIVKIAIFETKLQNWFHGKYEWQIIIKFPHCGNIF